jgi:NAD(P)-dependent dehydrogenase (short-subunit alcohol dehydrogenase family)
VRDDILIATYVKEPPRPGSDQPAELEPASVFLASQNARYITGEIIGVTGGAPIT